MTLPILMILRLQVQPGRFWRGEPGDRPKTGRFKGGAVVQCGGQDEHKLLPI
ncbi:hypothetical protein EJ06DRAFT_527136 [Trichodelitschia bisporula]|uniref:Uncharacterized protein n=1 Tax=Trichodelitschia bisporula TaxID=703511 RepID=A0A6G1I5W6_9PEZI|nr:hypothetical protein EJ06DRAFT_527136 [Trichodelitschia bisporula]